MKLSIVVAAAQNGVIGRDNRLPWHIPEDLKYFKSITMGKPIIMGRKTFDSIGRPLPGRTNIVISRRADWCSEGVNVVPSLDAAIALAQQLGGENGEAMIIGGGQIYRLALPRAERLYITRIEQNVSGDAQLPEIDWSQWREISSRPGCDESVGMPYRFIRYDRIG